MSNGGQNVNDRNLVSHIRAVMGPANPVPVTAFEGELDSPARLAGQLAELRAAALPGFDEPDAGQAGPRGQAGRRGQPGQRGRAWRVLAPALSGIAVVAIAVSAVSLAAGAGAARPQRPSAGAGGNPEAGMPPVYLTLNGTSAHRAAALYYTKPAALHDWETFTSIGPIAGAVFKPRKLWNFQVVYWTTQHHRPFVESDTSTSTRLGGTTVSSRLHLDATGPQDKIEAVAHCPGGLAVALAVPVAGIGLTTSIQLVVGGKLRVWSAPATPAAPSDLTCVGSQKIAYLSSPDSGPRSELRELDLTAPAGDLLHASRVILGDNPRLGHLNTAFASPAGGPVIATMYRDLSVKVPSGKSVRVEVVRLVALSPRTGKLIRTFETVNVTSRTQSKQNAADRFCAVLALDATGNHAIVNCAGLHRLDHGVLTRLPDVKRNEIPHKVTGADW